MERREGVFYGKSLQWKQITYTFFMFWFCHFFLFKVHFLIQIKFLVIFKNLGTFFSLHAKSNIGFNFWAQRLKQEDFFLLN